MCVCVWGVGGRGDALLSLCSVDVAPGHTRALPDEQAGRETRGAGLSGRNWILHRPSGPRAPVVVVAAEEADDCSEAVDMVCLSGVFLSTLTGVVLVALRCPHTMSGSESGSLGVGLGAGGMSPVRWQGEGGKMDGG